MSRSVLFTIGTLVLAAGVFGFVAGQNFRPLSETDVINAAASWFEEETGGSRAACLAVPGERQIWISVHCAQGEAARSYHFDQNGRLINREQEPST